MTLISKIKIKLIEGDFFIVPNKHLLERMGAHEKLVYLALCEYKNNLTFECYPSVETIRKTSGLGRSTTFRAINELEKLGVISRSKGQRKSNLYRIHCIDPGAKVAHMGPRGGRGQVHSGDPNYISRKSEEQYSCDRVAGYVSAQIQYENPQMIEQVTTVIQQFANEVDPKNKTYLRNKTQRKAARFLIEEYGFDETTKLIGMLRDITPKIPYCPSITTPTELRDKWLKLQDAVHRMRLKNKPSTVYDATEAYTRN